jgi:lipoprotein LprG
MSPRTLVAAVLLPLVLAANGCTHSQKATTDPTTALAAAKRNLDATTGVHLTMSTPSLPQGVSGILTADGVATHDPAFRGNIKVLASGITAQVPVVAVGGKVYAKLPFTTKYVVINPADYGAPDPAGLMEARSGISSLLTAATGLSAGSQTRAGKTVVSTYDGRLSGAAVATVIPSARTGGTFTASFSVDAKDDLTRAVLTGPFYATGGNVTYTIGFDAYGSHPTITAP